MYSTHFKQNNILIISLKPLNAIVEFAVPSIYVVKDILEIISRRALHVRNSLLQSPTKVLDTFQSHLIFYIDLIQGCSFLLRCYKIAYFDNKNVIRALFIFQTTG